MVKLLDDPRRAVKRGLGLPANHLNQNRVRRVAVLKLQASFQAPDKTSTHHFTTQILTVLANTSVTMALAKGEEKGESSTAAYKAHAASPTGNPTYELPW